MPSLISAALSAGTWRDPGPAGLSQVLGDYPGPSELKLFSTPDRMADVARQLDTAGYVDDPQFCLVRAADLAETGLPAGDDRLVFDQALFIAGSVYPGDDVLVAVDRPGADVDPLVLGLDWERPVPHRWVRLMRLSAFVAGLAELSAQQGT